MKYKLIKGDVDEFAIIEEKLPDNIDDLIVTCSINAKINVDDRIIAIVNTVRYADSKKDLLKIKSTLYFKIDPDSWNDIYKEESLILRKVKGQHLGIIAIGATRGMLIVKTANTPYANVLLPPINVKDLINDDIKFEISKKDKNV